LKILTGSWFELVDPVLVWLVLLSPALFVQVLDVLRLVQRATQPGLPPYVLRLVDAFTIASRLLRPLLSNHNTSCV